MKKQKLILGLSGLLLVFSAYAQKPAAIKKAPAAGVTNAEGVNTLSYTLVDEKGASREIIITSTGGKTGFLNAVRVDKMHTDDSGENHPVTKADVNSGNMKVTFYIPVINSTGTAEATYNTNYTHTVGWYAAFDGYRLSPQKVMITVTQWAEAGGYIEGIFSGTASLINENKIYDSDNPAPTCTIKNGKFRILRVKDQTSYGGEG